jgi:IS4 transposase
VFFKYLKQSIEIKSFIGVNPNAVRIQIWTALIAKLLIRYMKKKAKYKWNTSNLVAFIRFILFVKIDLWKWLDDPFQKTANSPPD